jgi:hypothetical protein
MESIIDLMVINLAFYYVLYIIPKRYDLQGKIIPWYKYICQGLKTVKIILKNT